MLLVGGVAGVWMVARRDMRADPVLALCRRWCGCTMLPLGPGRGESMGGESGTGD